MFELPKLDYKYDSLEPAIDARTMEIHHTKHHQGYIDKLNIALEGSGLDDKEIEELLTDLESIPKDIRTAVRNNGGGHVNHSLFWKTMVPKGKGGKPSDKISVAINEAFGSGENCHKTFIESVGKLFGSGWVWLVVNSDKKLEIMTTSNQDSPLSVGKKPILGLDVWEHAYYLNYQNKRQDYAQAWSTLINWDYVNKLYEDACA